MDGRSNLVVRSRHWIEFVRTGFDLDLIQMDNIIGEESFFFFFWKYRWRKLWITYLQLSVLPMTKNWKSNHTDDSKI